MLSTSVRCCSSLASRLAGQAILALDTKTARPVKRPRPRPRARSGRPRSRRAKRRRPRAARPRRARGRQARKRESSSGRSSGERFRVARAHVAATEAARKPSAQIISPAKLGPCDPPITSPGQVRPRREQRLAHPEAPEIGERVGSVRARASAGRPARAEGRGAGTQQQQLRALGLGRAGGCRKPREQGDEQDERQRGSSRKRPKESEPRGCVLEDSTRREHREHPPRHVGGRRETPPSGYLGNQPDQGAGTRRRTRRSMRARPEEARAGRTANDRERGS